MSSHDDPVEFIGADRTTRADPVTSVGAGKRVPRGTQSESKPGGYIDKNGTPTASHLKHAVVAPAKEYEAAKAETVAAMAEVRLAKIALADAEHDENNALAVWLSLRPTIDADALLREYAKRSTEERARQVAMGNPPEGVKTPTHGRSPVDIAAAQRQRASPQSANVPLRSPVARRVV